RRRASGADRPQVAPLDRNRVGVSVRPASDREPDLRLQVAGSQELRPPPGDHAGDLGTDPGVVLLYLHARRRQGLLDLVDLRVESRGDAGRSADCPVRGYPKLVITQSQHPRRVETERVGPEPEDVLTPIERHHENNLCDPPLLDLAEISELLRGL